MSHRNNPYWPLHGEYWLEQLDRTLLLFALDGTEGHVVLEQLASAVRTPGSYSWMQLSSPGPGSQAG